MAFQRAGDRPLIGTAAPVAQLGELLGVALPRQDRPNDRLPRHPGDVAHHVVEQQVHLPQRLLHVPDAIGRLGDQALALTQIGPQRHQRLRRPEGPAQQAIAVQLLQPLAVQHVALAAGNVAHVTGIDQHHLQPAPLQDLVQRNPLDPGRLHRHRLDAELHQPVRQTMQVTAEAGELPHRLGRQIRRHRHEVAPRPDVDARRKQIDLLQLRPLPPRPPLPLLRPSSVSSSSNSRRKQGREDLTLS